MSLILVWLFFFFSSRRRHTRFKCDWSSDVCSSDLHKAGGQPAAKEKRAQTEDCQQHQHERALVNYRVRPADKTIRTAFPIAIEDVKEFPERPPALVSSFLWFWPHQPTRTRRATRTP